jgi:prepilin-type N-terminal cleavage/methylation domain-containing protein
VTKPVRARRNADDKGFALVEVLAASTILVIVLVSFSTVLVDSLRAALLSRQSEVAASISSDMIENAKALTQGALSDDLGTTQSCVSLGAVPVPVPVRTASATTASQTVAATDFRQCFSILVDSYVYTVSPSVTTIGSPDTVTVSVTWLPSGSYSTSAQIGQ